MLNKKRKVVDLRLVGNVIWFIFGGAILGLVYLLAGALFSLTVIMHPIGKACFNISKLMFAPFGKEIIKETELKGSDNVNGVRKAGGLIMNILWLPIGIPLMFAHVGAAIIMFLGIITIPFGFVHFKLARIAIWPIGAKVVSKELASVARNARAEEEFADINK